MKKTLTIAAFVAALSTAAVPFAHAQDATQPPSAPTPSEAMKGGDGGDAAKGDAAKSDAGKSDSPKKSGSMKKSSKHHASKKKHM